MQIENDLIRKHFVKSSKVHYLYLPPYFEYYPARFFCSHIQSSYAYIYLLNFIEYSHLFNNSPAHGKQHLNKNNFFEFFYVYIVNMQGKLWIAKRYGIWYDVL